MSSRGCLSAGIIVLAGFAVVVPKAVQSQELLLDGRSLTSGEVVAVARSGRLVDVNKSAWERVRISHEILMAAAKACQKIYGLTTGVGANKDRSKIECTHEVLSDETLKASQAFNTGLLHAHAAGTGPPLSPEIVRAILLIRLNTALVGGTGMQEEVVRRFNDYLGHDILPVIPSRGSVGQADITVLSHIGLTMTGKWEVVYQGQRMPAEEALRQVGLPELKFVAKDALASFSSNAFSTALATFALEDMRQVSRMARLVYALSLEGLDGNIAPLLPEAFATRPFPFVAQAARDLRRITLGSYLYSDYVYTDPKTSAVSKPRPLQDPLSFRTAAYQIGTLDRTIVELDQILTIQLNSADDNPVVFEGEVQQVTLGMPEIPLVKSDGYQGVVVPSASFSSLPLVIAVQSTAIAGAHLSMGSALRTFKLSDPEFTRLPMRFLAARKGAHAFGAIQKPIVALLAENKDLANPVSLNFLPVALDVEDMATNAPAAARRLGRIADNLMAILGFELMHAAQAVDLRLIADPKLQLSDLTRQFMVEYRTQVPFLSDDNRILSRDIAASRTFLHHCQLQKDSDGAVDWARQLENGSICDKTDINKW